MSLAVYDTKGKKKWGKNLLHRFFKCKFSSLARTNDDEKMKTVIKAIIMERKPWQDLRNYQLTVNKRELINAEFADV